VKGITKRYGNKQRKIHLIEPELRCNLGSNNFIFICSGCDLFANDIPYKYISAVINRTLQFTDNKYLLHTKNPERLIFSSFELSTDIHKICTTIETNRYAPGIMGKSPHPHKRAAALGHLADKGFETMVTIEPIIDFDHVELVSLIHTAKASQVNIGADSGHNNLPEPSGEKIAELISELEKFTTVHKKDNLRRLVA
jgi:DNA repair photolyase